MMVVRKKSGARMEAPKCGWGVTLRRGGGFDTREQLESNSLVKLWVLRSLGGWSEEGLLHSLPPPPPKSKATLDASLFQTGRLHRIAFEPSVWQFMQNINEVDCIGTESPSRVKGAPGWQHKSKANHKSRQYNASQTDRPQKSWQVLHKVEQADPTVSMAPE